MRKFLITMMCIIMVVCFMPTVAMAEVETLPTAIDGVITLSEDVVLSESWTIDSSETFVLNLNGYSIKFTNAGVGIKNDGKLTINDTEGGRVFTTDVAAQGRATIANYGTLEINGGTFGDSDIDRSNPNGVNRGNALRNYGTATINGGYFTACDNYTNGGYAYAIANGSSSYNDAQMTINNATVYGKMNGVIASDGGTLIVKNGSFTLGDGTSSNNFYMAYTSGEGKIKVEGGTFERNVNNNYGFFYEDGSTSEIIATGGTFSSDVSAYVPEGTQTVDNGDGKYSLAPADNAVAQIGVAGYVTLQAAIASATNGQTVTLLKDTAYETNGSGLINITKSITIDGNGYSISGYGNRSGNKTTMAINNNGSTEVDVTLKDLTINNNGEGGRAVETRGNIHSLKIENCVFNCIGTGNTQVLTIGGDQSSPASISIDKSELNAGTSGYPIIAFNPMKLQITNNSLLSGYCGVYFKGVSGSEGSHGSVVNALDSAFDCPNVHNGNSNDFGVFTLEDDNVAITLTNCFINAEAQGEAAQAVLLASGRADRASGYSIGIAGDSVINGILLQSGENWTNSINKYVITGGTFSSDPTEYVPANSRYYVSREGGKYVVRYSTPTTTLPPTTPTDNVTNSGTSGTDNATTSADLSGSTSTSNGTTSATVDKTTADKIVDKAVENKSEEIVIDATANTTTAADSTTIAQVTIPTETLGAIAEKTEADVTIKTDVAEVKLDNASAAAVAEQAEGDTVQIIAEKVKEDAAEVHFELKVVCSDGKVISDFKGGNVAVTVALPKAIADKKVVCVYIDDNGHMSKVAGQKNADGTYTFNTGHFSSYAIMAEEEADAAIAAQKEAIKNIKIKLTSKQVKTKAGKKAVKITWTAAAGDKVLDGVEVYRSTERYKGYGTEPFYTSTKGGNTGSYTNTKSLKKGTRYYYRVRGYVLVDGQKVYTDYSTKAWRTVK